MTEVVDVLQALKGKQKTSRELYDRFDDFPDQASLIRFLKNIETDGLITYDRLNKRWENTLDGDVKSVTLRPEVDDTPKGFEPGNGKIEVVQTEAEPAPVRGGPTINESKRVEAACKARLAKLEHEKVTEKLVDASEIPKLEPGKIEAIPTNAKPAPSTQDPVEYLQEVMASAGPNDASLEITHTGMVFRAKGLLVAVSDLNELQMAVWMIDRISVEGQDDE